MVKRVVKPLQQLHQGVLTVGRYLHGDSVGERQAWRYNGAVENSTGSVRSGSRGPREYGMEPRDPLEITILGGDRDEYIDKSFWHDAEAASVTFDESRVDGIWDEDGSESWK